MIAEILQEIEEEAAANRGGRLVLGVERILAQDPRQPLPGKVKKSPAPVLFYSKRPELRRGMENDYKDFQDEYMLGSSRLVEAAERGYRLDPGRYLPEGSLPPAVVESILKATGVSIPRRCSLRRASPAPGPRRSTFPAVSTRTSPCRPSRTKRLRSIER